MRPSVMANALTATAAMASKKIASCFRIGWSPVFMESTASRRSLFETEVGLVFEAALEILKQAHAFVRLQDVGFDRAVDLRLHALFEVAPVVLRHRQHFADAVSGNLFLDVEAALFVRLQIDVHLVDAPEEIVDVAHDVLVRASEEDAEVVGLAVTKVVERNRFADVVQIDVLLHFSVGVARDVDERRLELRPLVQAMNGHDREELPEGPVIEERLEDGEIADVLIGQLRLERLQILGHFAGVGLLHDHLNFFGDLPEQRLHARFDVEVEQAELEHRLRLFFDLLEVVPRLVERVLREAGVDVQDLANQFVIAGADLVRLRGRLLDRAERLHDQHGVMRNDRPAGFRHDVRMRHALVVADVHDVVDDVGRVFLDRVIHRGVERGSRAVVVDGQAAADIEVLQRMAELEQLRVVHRRLTNGALDRLNVRDLRADVEVEQLERGLHLRLAQDLDGFENLGGGETELRVLAAGRRPFARAFRQEADADADPRLDVHLRGDLCDRAQLRQLLGDDDDFLAELAA